MTNLTYGPSTALMYLLMLMTWTNMDDAPHTVTTSSGPDKIDSPQLNKGDSFSYTFTKAGTYEYYCAVHPHMRGKVMVTN